MIFEGIDSIRVIVKNPLEHPFFSHELFMVKKEVFQ